jgi:hypothetical protein
MCQLSCTKVCVAVCVSGEGGGRTQMGAIRADGGQGLKTVAGTHTTYLALPVAAAPKTGSGISTPLHSCCRAIKAC